MSEPIQTSPSLPNKSTDNQDTQFPRPAAAEKPEAPKDAPGSANSPAIDVKALTDGALHFLATASNETLGACLLGLGVGTYLVLGRVGLLLIGVVGGVALHATWEGQAHGPSNDPAKGQEARRRELGADVARRLLDWRNTAAQGKEGDQIAESGTHVNLYSGKQLDYSEFRPETAAALTELTDAVIRDYVKYVASIPRNYMSNTLVDGGILLSCPPRTCFPHPAARP